jgi:hypothetical protein
MTWRLSLPGFWRIAAAAAAHGGQSPGATSMCTMAMSGRRNRTVRTGCGILACNFTISSRPFAYLADDIHELGVLGKELAERRKVPRILSHPDISKRAGDTFVDFDSGLNKAMNRLREALADCAENPRFIETLPKRGYRFIAPVEQEGPSPTRVADDPRLAKAHLREQFSWGVALVILMASVLARGRLLSRPRSTRSTGPLLPAASAQHVFSAFQLRDLARRHTAGLRGSGAGWQYCAVGSRAFRRRGATSQWRRPRTVPILVTRQPIPGFFYSGEIEDSGCCQWRGAYPL